MHITENFILPSFFTKTNNFHIYIYPLSLLVSEMHILTDGWTGYELYTATLSNQLFTVKIFVT
jgi:hypothetical protein